MENNNICSYCKTENPENAKHCMGCGKSLSKKILVKQCPKCQSFFDNEDSHCGLCGNPLFFTEITEDLANDTAKNVENAHENAIICRHCGSDNFEIFQYCSKCGLSLVASRKRFCSFCGAESSGIYTNCVRCGNSILVKPKVPATPQKKTQSVDINSKLLSTFSLLILATLVFVLSFLPIFKMEAEILNIKNAEFKINTYQSVALVFDNIQNKSDKALKRTNLYEDIEEYEDDLSDLDISIKDGEINLSKSKSTDFSKYLLKSYKLSLRSEDTALSSSIVIASLASLTYIVASALALVFAFASFLSCFADVDDYSRFSIGSLFAAPFAAAVAYIGITFATQAGNIGNPIGSLIKTDLTSPALVFTIIATAILVCAKLTITFALKSKKISLGSVLYNALILTLSILILFSTTFSIVDITIDAKLSGSDDNTEITIPLTADLYESFNGISSKTNDEIEELFGTSDFGIYINLLLQAYKNLSIDDLINGDGDALIKTIVSLSVVKNRDNGTGVFASTKTFILLTSVFAALIGAIALYNLTNAKKFSPLITFSASLASTMATLAIIYNFMCIKKINDAFDSLKLSEICSASIGKGIIFFIIFAVAMVIISSFKRRVSIKGSNVSERQIKQLLSIGK